MGKKFDWVKFWSALASGAAIVAGIAAAGQNTIKLQNTLKGIPENKKGE